MPLAGDTRESQRRWDATRAVQRANIGPIPKPKDQARRDACAKSLRLFLETYFPKAFRLKWSDDHLEVIEKTQSAVLTGGAFAMAMPRGSGKTTIHQRAAIWAINYGYRPYVFLVAADAKKANGGLRSIKTEYEFNPLLYADFPEICIPVRELQGASQAAKKQHVDGVPTLIDWTAECAQLPHVEGSVASGARIGVGGITAAARGAQVTLPDGEVLRPSLVLVDDFQTRESAASPTQCKTRLDTLTGDLMGMRGPGDKFAMLVTSTVIYQGDAADQLLDRKKFPEFHGVRKKLVYSWPTNENLWDEYAELRRNAFRVDREPVEADKFYADNRAEMDAGAVVAWPERKLDEELSALQHAYNLRISDPDAFEAEYQNSPVGGEEDDVKLLTQDEIANKITGRPKDALPADVRSVTAAIDVQGNSLWWSAVGWEEGYNGYVADFGIFPKQTRRFVQQRDLPRTLATQWPELTEDQAIYRGLDELITSIAGRRWVLDGGAEVGVSRILVDEGYKEGIVHAVCKRHAASNILVPAKGIGIGASRDPMVEWAKKQGEVLGHNWRHRFTPSRAIRHIVWDANFWKTFLHERWATPPGGIGCLLICGQKSIDNQLFASHMLAESPRKTTGRGRDVVEWIMKPARPDNHWLDTLAMNCVAASRDGIELVAKSGGKQRQRTRKSLADFKKTAAR